MKKVILVGALALFGAVNAQIAKGTAFISGTVGYQGQKNNNNDVINTKKRQIEDNKKALSSLSRKVAKLDEDDDDDKDIITTYEDEIKEIHKENRKLEEQIIKLETENLKDIKEMLDISDNNFYDKITTYNNEPIIIADIKKLKNAWCKEIQ